MSNRFYKIIIYISIMSVLLMLYIYPIYNYSVGWTIVTLFDLGFAGFLFIAEKKKNYNKYAAVWLLTLLPLIFNNYSIKEGEFGFTLLWLFFVLFLLLIEGRGFWIKSSFHLILFMTGLYAITTIMMNIGFTAVLSTVAYLFRGGHPIDVGTLETAGITRHYSHNGIYIATGFIMACSALLSKFNKKNIVITLIFLVGLLFTQKRGPLMAALFSIILTSLIISKHKLTTKAFWLSIGILVVISVSYVGYMLFPRLFAVIDRFSTDNLLTDRQYLWHEALVMFNDSPLFGSGFGAYPHKLSVTIDTVEVTYLNAHNIYLQLLAETGIIGFICFIIPMLISLINTMKLFSKSRLYLTDFTTTVLLFSAVMQLFFLVDGITENTLYDRTIYVPYLLSIAYYLSIYKLVKVKTTNICVAKN